MAANTFRILSEDMAGERWYQDSRGFDSLYYEGNTGVLLGGVGGAVYVIEDKNTDNGSLIPLKWLSRYLDQKLPNNEKTYQDLVIEADTKGAAFTVTVLLNNGDTETAIGSILTSKRETVVLPIESEFGVRARNIAIKIEGNAPDTNDPVKIFKILLHYYVEARAGRDWDSDEFDAGTQAIKRIRAIELDLENASACQVTLASDLPSNAMATRAVYSLEAGTTRRKVQIPVADYVEGRHLRVIVHEDASAPAPFYLYGAKAWIQPYGTYIEAYEGEAGQYYDSFSIPIVAGHVCRAKEIELDIDTDGAITADVKSDLPGNDLTVKKSSPVNTESTTTGRRMVRIPLEPYPEGRLWRVVLSGDQAMRLYGARLEVKPYGVYVEAYEASGGRTWDSDYLELGTPKVKEFREVQFDIDTDGALTMNVYTEIPGQGYALRATETVNTETTTSGRRMVNIPITTPIEGRSVRIELAGTSAFRLYGCWLFARAIGYYVEGYVAAAGHYWDSSVVDLGAQNVKRILQLEIEAQADSPLTVETYTSNAAGDMALRATDTLPASATRHPYIVQLTSVYGRLLRLKITGSSAWKLFKVRAYVKPIGVYLNGSTDEIFPVEPEQDLGSERVKLFKEIEVVYSAASTGTVKFYTELPSGVAQVKQFTLAASSETTTAKLRLPPTAKGRLLKVEFLPGTGDLRVYKCRIWTRTIGEAGGGAWRWVTLPLPATPDNYQWVELYVAPTPPAWDWGAIPVAKTPIEWQWAELPVTKTPELPQWVDLPVEL